MPHVLWPQQPPVKPSTGLRGSRCLLGSLRGILGKGSAGLNRVVDPPLLRSAGSTAPCRQR